MQEEIQKQIDEIYDILTKNTGWILQGKRKERFDKYIERLSELEQQLNNPSATNNIYSIKKEVYILEAEAKKFRDYNLLLPSFLGIYAGLTATLFIITSFDIPKFLTTTLGVSAPEKLISFGIAGALLYLATNILMKISSSKQSRTILDITIRILLAIMVPIILVSLLFSDKGELIELKITPELISFVCGYSANLVVETMNKMVEKASSMVKAI